MDPVATEPFPFSMSSRSLSRLEFFSRSGGPVPERSPEVSPRWDPRHEMEDAVSPSSSKGNEGYDGVVEGQWAREVARRAGLDPDYVASLVRLGILSPGEDEAVANGDVRRARWVHGLDQAGIPLDGMAAAVRDGALSFSFLDASAFDRFKALSSSTFAEVSERTGIPIELLMVVREARGYAEPRPEDRVREDELLAVPVIELQLAAGFRPTVIERWLRVCGDSLRRIAETETDWYGTEVVRPLLESGMSEGEMLEAQAGLGSQLAPLAEQALVAIYHGQQEHAWSTSFVEEVEGALERAGLHKRMHMPPAVCFLDITGYTALTEEWGDRAAAEVATRLATFVRRCALDHGGRPVKWLGDGVMFYFPNPGPSVLAALEMVEGTAAHSLPPAHLGIHAGPVVFQEGDYFGRTVNIAARIADYARPGEVLVSQEVVEVVGEEMPVTFTEVGPVELKGVFGTPLLHSAGRTG